MTTTDSSANGQGESVAQGALSLMQRAQGGLAAAAASAHPDTVTNVLEFFQKAQALLATLTALGVVHTSNGLEIGKILTDVSAVVAGRDQPTAALAGNVVELLHDLGVQGPGLEEASKFATFAHNVETGQVGTIRAASLFGVAGEYAFIPATSDTGKALGLS